MNLKRLINEEILKLDSNERRELDKFINLLKKKYPPKNDGYDIIELLDELDKIAIKRTKEPHNLPHIYFIYNTGISWYAHFNAYASDIISVNLFQLSYSFGDHTKVNHIMWDEVKSTIIHEWIHKKQFHRGGMEGFKSKFKRNYYNRPREINALAAGEVEALRSLFATTDPEDILSILRHSGLSDSDLKRLKSTNPDAWKKIMKKAVLYAISSLK